MRAKDIREARDAFVAQLRAVAGCVADRPLISFAPPLEPAPLRHRGGGRLLSDIRCDYIVTDADASPNGIVTIVGSSDRVLDAMANELLAYHLHIQGPSPIVDPHLHVAGAWRTGLATRSTAAELDDLHLPTGRVSLSDVVRLLIVDFGVQPRRPDWESVRRRT